MNIVAEFTERYATQFMSLNSTDVLRPTSRYEFDPYPAKRQVPGRHQNFIETYKVKSTRIVSNVEILRIIIVDIQSKRTMAVRSW